jgi:Uma2 family endonuclease
MAGATRVRFKAEDIFDVPDDGIRYEVIDGDLYMTKSPDLDHQEPISILLIRIGAHVLANRLGHVFTAPVGLILDGENGLQPDLVAEVLSPSTAARDRGVKRRRYAAAGVPHYWILDPDTLEAYRLREGGYDLIGTFSRGTTFTPELFPGLEIPIDELWQLQL